VGLVGVLDLIHLIRRGEFVSIQSSPVSVQWVDDSFSGQAALLIVIAGDSRIRSNPMELLMLGKSG